MTHTTLADRLTSLVTDLAIIVEAANAADKAYNDTVGTPDSYVAFGADNPASVQNNAPVLRAVLNASLVIAKMRGDDSDTGRMKALADIASWTLTETEALLTRAMANCAWWTRNLSRDLSRATRPVCMDFNLLPPNEVIKDDNLMKAVSGLLVSKLQNS